MMRKKRWTAAALSAVMGVSTLSGCGTSALAPAEDMTESQAASVEVNPAGEYPIVDDKITLTVLTTDNTYVGALENVDFVKWYEDMTNIHIEWTEIPKDGSEEKLNLMLSTGNLPDIILGMTVNSSDVTSYGEDGTFLMLDDYIDEYGYEFNKVLEENEGLKSSITSPDGHIYALPSINDCLHNEYRTRAWINQDWLDAVGMDMPKTTEEFEAVLQAFKDQDPNGNGIADEIPLLGNREAKNNVITWLMNAFIYMNASDQQDPSTLYLYLDDGTLQFTPNKEEYREGLEWIHSLVEKGLIDTTSFTQDETQFKQVIRNEDAVSVGVIRADLICTYTGQYVETEDHRIDQYRVLEPLIGPDGFQYQPSYPWAGVKKGNFIITNKCKYPEAAFRWADGWYNEEASFYAWYGFEGRGWEQPPEGSVAMNGDEALYEQLPVEGAEQTIRISNVFGNNTARLRESAVYREDDPTQRYSTEPVLYFAVKESLMPYADSSKVVPPLSLTREESSEVSNIRAMVNDYVEENMALFALGTKNVESEWDAYVKEFDALGLDRMMEIYQSAYDRQYKN